MDPLLRLIRELFESPFNWSCEKLTLGESRDVWLLEDNSKRFVLKCFDLYQKLPEFIPASWRVHMSIQKRLQTALAVQYFFHHRGIPVLLPVKTVHLKHWFNFRNSWYALYPYQDGVSLRQEDLCNDQLISLAQLLARMHIVGKESIECLSIHDNPHAWRTQRHRADFFKSAQSLLRRMRQDAHQHQNSKISFLIKNILEEKIALAFEENVSSPRELFFRPHVVHGDYQHKNVIFNQDGLAVAVLDFEKADIFPRIFEIIRSMDYICISCFPPTSEDISRARVYLQSYAEIYEVPRKEFILGMKEYLRRLVLDCSREYRAIVYGEVKSMYLEKDLQRLRYLSSSMNDFIEKVLK